MSDAAVVGIVGEERTAVCDAIEAAGLRTATGDSADVLAVDPDLLVAVGERALPEIAATTEAPAAPVLPVDAGAGVGSAPQSAVDDAVKAWEEGSGERRSVPVIAAVVDGEERARALLELFLVTAEHARISEYTVTATDTHVSRFRADGVVVATPAGSHGYARSIGAPVLAAGTDVVAVEPVAPFAVDADHWVLPSGTTKIRIERDEADVELLADGQRAGLVAPGVPVSITPVDTLDLLAVPQCRPLFGRSE